MRRRDGWPRRAVATLCLAIAPALGVDAQAPARVTQLAKQAGIVDPVLAWCQGQFRPGQRGYAIAAGGRYLALDGSSTAIELSAFSGKPDVSCYSQAQAQQLHRDIRRSDTISGEIVPRFDASVICGFTDPTTARCWQYSPAERVYVEVGGWSKDPVPLP